MIFNWLDIVLLVILIIALIFGAIRGLIRQIIGILAVIVGLVLAIAYFPYVAGAFKPLVSREVFAAFLGFLAIFLIVLLLGWLLGRMFTKAMKGPLKLMNHAFGAFLGLVKGVLICGILVFAMMVFPIDKQALTDSAIAPYCVEITRSVIDLIPDDLKQKFSEAYKDIFGEGKKDVERV